MELSAIAFERSLGDDQRRNQRLVRGAAKRLSQTDNKRQAQDVPDLDHRHRKQARQQESAGHLHDLRSDQQLAPVCPISHDPADQGEQENGNLAEKRIKPKQKRGVGHLQNQPILGDRLHPGADA